MENKEKPVVKTEGEWEIYTSINGSPVMIFSKVLDHPRLGTEFDVRSSKVLSVDFQKGICETLNTIYHFDVNAG